MTKIIKPTEQVIRKMESILRNISVSIKLGKLGFEFSLAPKSANIKIDLKSLLITIDELLIKNNKKAVIFIDEMQTIAETEASDEIESALRFVAQKTNKISFIFSGSSRHLLGKIFDDRSRPLYKLCHTMAIQRISADHYKIFINRLAKIKWKKPIPNGAIDQIVYFTKLHPYYINILCSYLFELVYIPDQDAVLEYWEKICREEQSSIAKDIELLTPKQKHLLKEIAKHSVLIEPTASDFVKKTNLTPKGISDGIKMLMRYDLVEKLEIGEIRVIDPVLEYWARRL